MPFFLVCVRKAVVYHADSGLGNAEAQVPTGIVLIQAFSEEDARSKIIDLASQDGYNPGCSMVAAALEDPSSDQVKQLEITQHDDVFCLCVDGLFMTKEIFEKE